MNLITRIATPSKDKLVADLISNRINTNCTKIVSVNRCLMWNFESCDLVRRLAVNDTQTDDITFCCFLNDMFLVFKRQGGIDCHFRRNGRSPNQPDWETCKELKLWQEEIGYSNIEPAQGGSRLK